MISKHNAEHYIWGERCDGWRLVDQVNRSIIHEKMPRETSEVRHYHQKSVQFFFVLSGTLNIEVDGVEHTLREQEGIEISPFVAHRAYNSSLQDTEFLVISQPNTRDDRVVVS